jgi:endonuclease III
MPRESKIDLKKRAAKVFAILKKRYPDVHCYLDFKSPLELLVATILSAQCTDVRVNLVTPGLFKKYPSAEALAAAPQEELEQEVRTTGFYRNKSKSIRGACAKIVAEFGGRVPETMEQLLTLPGVARKTANVVLAHAFGINAGVTVDTHVRRLAGRLGLTRQSEPRRIEPDLMKLVPRPEWENLSIRLIFHGRAVCTARKPACGTCPIAHLCPSHPEA